MVQKVELDEREHALRILLRLDRMKQHQQHCDFIVSVDGNEFHTHRNILSAGSDYFNAMLTHNTKESQLGKVEMMDVDSECVGICLNYIYTGKAEIPEGETEQLIGVATLMQLDKLTNAISQLLKLALDVNSFYCTKRIAEKYDLQDLLATCRAFEQENALLLSSQDDFQSEGKNHVVEILTSASLTEQEKLVVSLRWVGGLAEKKSSLLDFLKSIKLEEVPEDYLRQVFEGNPLIENDFDLYKIFSAAIMKILRANSTNRNSYEGMSLVLFDGSSDSLHHLNARGHAVELFHEEKFVNFGNFTAVSLHSYIYILLFNKSVYRLGCQDKTAKWEKLEDMIECHGECPPAISLNGFLYVIGGSYYQISSAVEKFCPGDNRWVRLKNKPIPTEKAVLVTLDEFMYSLGGKLKVGASNTLYKFNPQSEEWTELEPMRQSKYSCGAVAMNQKIYVLGGKFDAAIFSDMDCYDVTLNQWTKLSPMMGNHYLINAHVVSGWIFAIARFQDSDTIEKYDIERDEWQAVKLNGTVKFNIHDSVLI